MMISRLVLILEIFLLVNFISCSDSKLPKPDPGRCRVHADCPQGQECNDTRCEDLYYPRRKIKTY